MCIGNKFALLETRILLFHLLACCQLSPVSTILEIDLRSRTEKEFINRIDHLIELFKCD